MPMPNRIVSSSVDTPQLSSSAGSKPEQQRGDDARPKVVHAAHEHDRQERDRVLDRELVDVHAAARRRPAGRRRRRP